VACRRGVSNTRSFCTGIIHECAVRAENLQDQQTTCPANDSAHTNTPANSKCASSSSSHPLSKWLVPQNMRSSCRAPGRAHDFNGALQLTELHGEKLRPIATLHRHGAPRYARCNGEPGRALCVSGQLPSWWRQSCFSCCSACLTKQTKSPSILVSPVHDGSGQLPSRWRHGCPFTCCSGCLVQENAYRSHSIFSSITAFK